MLWWWVSSFSGENSMIWGALWGAIWVGLSSLDNGYWKSLPSVPRVDQFHFPNQGNRNKYLCFSVAFWVSALSQSFLSDWTYFCHVIALKENITQLLMCQINNTISYTKYHQVFLKWKLKPGNVFHFHFTFILAWKYIKVETYIVDEQKKKKK